MAGGERHAGDGGGETASGGRHFLGAVDGRTANGDGTLARRRSVDGERYGKLATMDGGRRATDGTLARQWDGGRRAARSRDDGVEHVVDEMKETVVFVDTKVA